MESERGRSVQQTIDGSYVITGYTESFGAGDYDMWLIKTDANGDTLWTKTFGGDGIDWGSSVQQTLDSGYIITGSTRSYGAGNLDVWLIKTDANGDTLWTKTYGGMETDYSFSVQQTNDEGYIITGYTASFGVGAADVWLIKTDANGDTLWTSTYGGIDTDIGRSIQQTTDSGYIIAGDTRSFGSGNQDFWLIRLARDFNRTWYVSTTGSDSSGDGSESNPFASIQTSIDSSVSGDTVLVMPGTYFENINFSGKNITVGSLTLTTGDTSYISQTIIDGNDSGRVVMMNNYEDSTALLTGFTITNGNSSQDYHKGGGGIRCWRSSPRLENLIVKNNRSNFGGGICMVYSNSRLMDVVISDNETDTLYGNPPINGGGISLWESNCRLSNVTVINNATTGDGGGINDARLSTMLLENVTVAGNSAVGHGDGIYCVDSSMISVTNSIIWGNLSEPIYVGGGGSKYYSWIFGY